jgi:beta-RFAP synthase
MKTQQQIHIEAPARLHMGFLDLGGSLGRKFGSIGVGINEMTTSLTLTCSRGLNAEGPDAARALKFVEKLSKHLGKPLSVNINIHSAIPSHAGLGSGTQLALAIGTGLARLYGLPFNLKDLACLAGRGARSGIGIAVFELGGLIVDGGRATNTVVPPIISRMEMPSEWRFIIVIDQKYQGLHGSDEIEAFRSLPTFPATEAARLCHLLMMQGLPALAERDLPSFGGVITEIQRSVGDHFSPAQGGQFTSKAVKKAIEYLTDMGAVGEGQSSWGPTGFCLVESVERAESLISEATLQLQDYPEIQFLIGTARNHGAHINHLESNFSD